MSPWAGLVAPFSFSFSLGSNFRFSFGFFFLIFIRHFFSDFYSAFFRIFIRHFLSDFFGFFTSLWLFFRCSSALTSFSRLVALKFFFIHHVSLDSLLVLYSGEATFSKVQPDIKLETGAIDHSAFERSPVLVTPFRFSGLSGYW